MYSLWQDVKFSARHLVKRPAETAFAVSAMALGIGASVAIFTVVNAVLLRPMPYPDSDRLVRIWDVFTKSSPETISVSAPELGDYRARSRSFEAIAAVQSTNFFLCAEKNPERVRGALVSPAMFEVLRVSPMLGRAFRAEEERVADSSPAIVSYGFWQRRLAGDPNVLGSKLVLDCAVATIVGVMPKGFDYPGKAEIWRPLVLTNPVFLTAGRGWRSLGLVGRLAPGVSIDRARVEMSTIADQLAAEHPASYPDSLGFDIVVNSLLEETVGTMRPLLGVLIAAVGLLFVIACANVGNLQLTQMAERAGEMAVRVALGAGHARLLAQVVVEQVMVCLCGGLIGLGLAMTSVRLLLAMSPEDSIPRVEEIHVDGWVAAFAVVVSVVTGIALGLLPALLGSGPTFGTSIRDNSRGNTASAARTRLRTGLVVAEVGLALVLLVTSALLARSLVALLQLQPGFRMEETLTARLSLLPVARVSQPHQKASFYERVLDAVRVVPGVRAVAAVTSLPLLSSSADWTVTIDGRPRKPGERAPSAFYTTASPGYFSTMRIPLLAGREIADSDAAEAPLVAVINKRMADLYWRGADPIGGRVKLGDARSSRPWLTVVGIAGDVPQRGIDAAVRPEMYVPIRQNPPSAVTLVLHSSADVEQLATSIRESVSALDPYQAVYNIRTMDDHLGSSLAQRRFSMILLGVFAAVALVLCVLGVYSVVSNWVAQRTRELGLRVALGADRTNVMLLILRHGAIMAAAGTALGLIGVLASGHLLAGLLFGVTARDPIVLLGGSAALFAVAMLACCVPAWRATRLDPLVCLKSQDGGAR